jgi:hypothetical protein
MENTKLYGEVAEPEPETAPLPDHTGTEKPPAWEMIEKGRYQPRRIRGSLLGRELG